MALGALGRHIDAACEYNECFKLDRENTEVKTAFHDAVKQAKLEYATLKEGGASTSEEERALREWLAAKGLEELTEVFMMKEYTDVGVMSEMGLDADDLDYLGISDPAHRDILTS